jgi:hypothetical protein
MEADSSKGRFPLPSEMRWPLRPAPRAGSRCTPYYTRFQPEDDGRFWLQEGTFLLW